jgi:precorrin-2 dehydrogenase/sirohydrochlorin ferrochelatase
VRKWAREGTIRWRKKRFEARDLAGAILVVAATSSPALQQKIFREAGRSGILCNSVDDPEHCDFFYPAVVRRGALQIAISTAGHSPALAQRLRKQLERQFGPDYARWLAHLGEARERLFRQPMSAESRRRLLHRLASERAFSAFVQRAR